MRIPTPPRHATEMRSLRRGVGWRAKSSPSWSARPPSLRFATVAHASDSTAQRDVEPVILAALSAALNVELLPRRRLAFPSGAWCEVDGASVDENVLVEVFAHQGAGKGGQRGKIARDALKLMALRHHRPNARLLIALADRQLVDSLTAKSWLAEALRTFSVDVVYVEITAGARAAIADAQVRQVMVNPTSTASIDPASPGA